MKKYSFKNAIRWLGITAAAFCVFSFAPRFIASAQTEGQEVYFDLLEGAIFDDDSAGRLTYDTSTKRGVVNAETTSWINRDFSYVEYEKVATPDGEKPYNQCTLEFSVTYSNISTLNSQENILGVQLTSGAWSLAYRVQGKLQYGYSSWLALKEDLDSPFANENQHGNYRIGKELLASTTTITVRATPKIGEENGSIVFTVNGTEMGSMVYESEEPLHFGLVASRNTATVENASLKVLGATGWILPPPPPSYSAFNGEQANSAFGYSAASNTGFLQAPSAEMSKPFGNIPDYKSVTLMDGTKTTPDAIVWEYEATFTNFNYRIGKDKDVPENYYGTGLSLITSDGVSLNMRLMYDGRLNVASSNATLFGLSTYGKNANVYGFSPKTNPDDCQQEITLKYTVDRKTGIIAYYVNNVQFGELTYLGKAKLNQFGFHTCYGGGTYKNVSLKMMDVASVELPPVYQVFNGEQKNDVFSYDGKAGTAYLQADKRNYTKAFGNVPSYKSLTLSDGTKAKSSELIWEYEARLSNFTYAEGALPYYGIGISLVNSAGLSLDMRIMYDGRLYVCAVPGTDAAEFGLSASGKIIDIPNFDPSTNPADCQRAIGLKFRVNRATGEIGYYVDGSLYGSVIYTGDAELNRYALHSWWGGGEYKDISLRVLDVVEVEVRDYYTEEYVPSNPYDQPPAAPNLNFPAPPVQNESCSGQLAMQSSSLALAASMCMAWLKYRKKKGDK